MKISIGCDHAGLELKNKLISTLTDINWNDCGTFSSDSVDYPDFADKVCRAVTHATNKEISLVDAIKISEMGILICGSGQGMAIRANRYTQIRAALCWNDEVTKLSREHNNANILCIGAKFVSYEEAVKMIHTFMQTPFSEGRHTQRVIKLSSDTGC